MTIKERLQEAIDNGEVIEIIYQGGSHPGTLREIAPLGIKNDRVRARCYSSNAVKSFLLSKILLPQNSEEIIEKYDPDKPKTVNYKSLSDLLDKSQDELKTQGWHIEYNETSISLHNYFKNGKPKKSAEVMIHYDEYAYNLIVGFDDDKPKIEHIKKTRPWSVRAESMITVTYATLDRAAETFLERAKLLSEKNK